MSLNRKMRRTKVTNEELNAALKFEEARLRKEFGGEINKAINDTVRITMTVVAYVMHKKHGWGQDRLSKLVMMVEDICDDVDCGVLDFAEVEAHVRDVGVVVR